MKARALILVPFVAYLCATLLLGDWIIDDAGISYAYARSVAQGHGFVSQPGRVPVEGFSNFLWVLTLVPLFWVHLFEPVWVPKLLGALCVFSTMVVVERTLRETTGRRFPGFLAISFLGTAPPIVIWTASGMENALFLLLVTATWGVAALKKPRWELVGGALSALAAMTRPEALVFCLSMPLVSVGELALRQTPPRRALVEMGRALAAFGGVWLPFLAFRLSTFGLPLPHTYYAKLEFASQGERLGALFSDGARGLREKILALGEAVAGPLGIWLFLAGVIGLTFVVRRRELSRAAATALVFLGLSSVAYVWMPNDWMGEFRFATPVVAMAWVTIAALAPSLLRILPPWAMRRPIVLGASGALAAAVLFSAATRHVRFAENPPTPYAAVERQFAKRFDTYAQALGVERGSILIADAGATLFTSKLTVYDVAGLTEPAVLRTLRMGTPVWHYTHPKFYDWVFEEIRPTFVVTHAFWTNVTALEQDPRFARDYVAIDSYADRYVKAAFGRDLHSGEFVRRDALRAPGALEAMRRSYAFPPVVEPFPVRLADRLEALRKGPPGAPELRRQAELAASAAKPNPNRAAALYRRLLASTPEDLGAREGLALVLDRAGRSGEAHDEWLSALIVAEKKPDPALAERARARLGDPTLPVPRENDEPGSMAYARRLLAAGRLLDSRRVTDRVLAQNPKNVDAYFLAGVGSAAEKRPMDAAAAYAKCVELAPQNADCLNNLGFTLALLGRFPDAVAPLELAIRYRPGWPLPKANLAWVKSEITKQRELEKPAKD